MKTVPILLGSVVMSFFISHNAIGQTVASPPQGVSDRKAAADLIVATLKKSDQENAPAEQVDRYLQVGTRVLKLVPTNVFVNQVLKEAMSQATATRDDRQTVKLLAEALRDAQATLAFKPFIEAPLPEGFPAPAPVGEIQIKQYPKYRLARTQMAGAENGAFWTLFLHIKKKDIAMTAPVEMTYETGKDKLRTQAMAFLYRSTEQGKAGQDEKVNVIDVPAMTVLSLGMRGDVSKAKLREAKGHLDAWLQRHSDEYEASGPLRVMGYNSPFVAVNRRFTEVEIPVRPGGKS